MSERNIIAIHDLRSPATGAGIPEIPALPAGTELSPGLLSDSLGRTLHDLRISVTDRCNFRCSYCMPKEVFDPQYKFLPQSSLLSFEEIICLSCIFVA